MRPDPPGRRSDADRDRVAQLWAHARVGHGWSEVADVLVRLRSAGVPVAALAGAAGVNQERVRAVCRVHGPDPRSVGNPLPDAGWVTTSSAARLLGVSGHRLERVAAEAISAGMCVVIGWNRCWHAPSLPGWWIGVTPLAADVNRQAARERVARVEDRVAAGSSYRAVAAAEGVHLATVIRDLHSHRDPPKR